MHGKPFKIVKLASMTDARGPSGVLLPDAERTTPFSRFLRANSLSELPDLSNVFKDYMSRVGLRAFLVEYLPLYSPEQALALIAATAVHHGYALLSRNEANFKIFAGLKVESCPS